ncbi:hypothetical protein SpCBS45565_g03454 [Spizellomyces sp. 'palustris']|nr:hypothetical protein SpCBS45565_g03454 [Spizellomyces sp. 'palustris']
MTPTATTRTHVRIDTEYSADAVEFCPIHPFTHVVAVGTYQVVKDGNLWSPDANGNLKETTTEIAEDRENVNTGRLGRLLLFDLTESGEIEGSISAKEVFRMETGAILDMKCIKRDLRRSHHPVNGQAYLGLVDALGQTQLLGLNEGSDVLVPKASHSNGKDGVLSLSLDWSNRVNHSDPRIIISESDGNIARLSITGGSIVRSEEWYAHEFEAWISAFDYWETEIVYTGGDDCTLKGWDLRTNPVSPTFTNRRHQAGVCKKESLSFCINIVPPISYDESIMIWDTRKMRTPLLEHHTGGGVWRLKWHPTDPGRLLAACMHNGFHILNVDTDAARCESVCSYMEHGSLAYGADWRYSNLKLNLEENPVRKSAKDTLGTCSFYDHIFHVWDFAQLPP